jgi:hypothetical protein
MNRKIKITIPRIATGTEKTASNTLMVKREGEGSAVIA